MIPMAKFLNEQPLFFEGTCGTRFIAERSDFGTGLEISKPKGISELDYTQDMFEFSWYFKDEILEKLNGFRGYKFSNYATITQRQD